MTIAPIHSVRPRALLTMTAGITAALLLVFTLANPSGTLRDPTPGAEVTPAGGHPAPPPPPVLPDDPPVNPAPAVGDGRTVVSFTFDDGTADQLEGAAALDAVGMPATFYAVTSWIGKPGYLSHEDLIDLRMSGHEIGGHTTTHQDLAQLPEAEVARQICNNRRTLEEWGYRPVSFAYPFTSSTPAAEAAVEACGFDTGRMLGGTRSPDTCAGCPPAETLPPADPFTLAAPDQVTASWTLQDLQQRVIDARDDGGGWVMLTFHDICDDPGTADCPASKSIRPELFTEFVQWLEEYQQVPGHRTSVATVGDTHRAAAGDDHPGYRPARSEPAAPVAPVGTNGVRNSSLESQDAAVGHPECFERGGWGDNRASWSTAPGRNGSVAQRLRVTGYVSGDAKLMPRMDLGTCSPSVTPGRRYDLRTSYTSTGTTQFAVHYRTSQGQWRYWTASPWFEARSEWTEATWTTPPVPEDATALSFGLALIDDGTLVTDDYSMIDPGDP